MDTSALEYELPPELIAQRPAERRDESRLLVYERASGEVRHRRFSELPEELADELVVVNETRVIPARLRLERPGGGEAEVLLLERVGVNGLWEGLARPSRRLKPGQRLGPVELVEPLGGGRWRLRLEGEPAGEAPLPPYITESLADPTGTRRSTPGGGLGSRADRRPPLHAGAARAARRRARHLHVGLDTFRPVESATLEEHEIHTERYSVEPAAWERIRTAERVLAVGTTTTRVLETLASCYKRDGARDPAPGAEAPGGHESSNNLLQGRTGLFITPGFEFKRVDSLLTNFHLPRSTLLALVMAFAGIEETRRLYELAIAERYRFYSFGDAMLIR